MAANEIEERAQGRADAREGGEPPSRMRLPLKTMDNVQAELARLYREGKSGKRDVSEVSKLANVLSILGRLIEGSELASRIEALEERGGRSA
jgi:hypothetical protein